MTNALDATMPATAKRILDRLGTEATLISLADGNTPIVMSPPAPVDQKLADGTHILMTDSEVFVAGSTLSSQPVPRNDRVLFGGAPWQVVAVMAFYAGAEVAAYKMVLRR